MFSAEEGEHHVNFSLGKENIGGFYFFLSCYD